jgi:hypothetical protein
MAVSRAECNRIVRIPAVITFAVTLVRLFGELFDLSPMLFGKDAGGGGSLIGISWLAPLFGIYFTYKLAKSGNLSAGAGKTLGFSLALVLAFMALAMGLDFLLGESQIVLLLILGVVSVVVVFIAYRGFPELAAVLSHYALAARIPVAIIMLFSIAGNWGTHYDAVPPEFPEMGVLTKWIVAGVIPQLTIWIAFTVLVGAIFGGIALFFIKPKLAGAE